ncbi:MAG TPA: LysR family transcriptional regulator [Rhodocyclaceae bacterium]|jgi:DNA-binding transcriptional LysR family regulator|nr:LysR family transcriptional regulator [Rhodocyclaceae bacterium]
MTDRLFALRLFSRIAHNSSFSKAGRELGLSQPSVSRIAAELEQEVGAKLMVRTTRAVTLTEAGADYLTRIEPILAALEEADHAARGTGELRGLLRVALSSSFAVRVVVPRLPVFTEAHPALRIEMLLSDQRQDLINEGADVALRLGTLPDSSATSRLIATSQRVLVAAPAYLAKAGTPKIPADLSDHAVIVGPLGITNSGWSFQKEGRNVSVRISSRLNISINEGAIAAAVAGMGIVQTSRWGCQAELDRGDLVEVLSDWQMGKVEVSAVFPAGRAAKPAARSFIDYLVGALVGSQKP